MEEIDKEEETLRNKIIETECKIIEMKCSIVALREQFDELGRIKQVPIQSYTILPILVLVPSLGQIEEKKLKKMIWKMY